MINTQTLQKNPYYLIDILLLLCGALIPLSHAPYEFFWLQFPLLAVLFLSCFGQTPAIGFRRGLLFGLGWFIHGIHWIFYSLHFHGGTPVFLAVIMVVMLAAVLSLFPALAFYLANRFIHAKKFLTLVLVYPLVLLVFEWLRGYVLTGLPWVQIGSAHIDTWLAGYAPLTGGLGVGLMACIISGLLAASYNRANLKITVPAIFVIYVSGFALGFINWTQPVGEPINVSMVQGNISQPEKWRPENYLPTLKMYRDLTRENWQSDLIIWPETAIPGYSSRIPMYLNDLAEQAKQTDTDVLLGVFVRSPETGRYYNSVITLDNQVYKKRHLVPLGEYFPFRPLLGFFAQWIDIPMSDIDLGDKQQTLIKAAGQTIGVSICFEDVFDRDVLLDVPEASLLVNVSNDAWFEDSAQPWQHHQAARMRALETGRSLLRVTNTGVSSAIGPKGEVLAMSQQFKRQVLNATVQGYQGATPYVIWANYLLIISALLVLLLIYRKNNQLD